MYKALFTPIWNPYFTARTRLLLIVVASCGLLCDDGGRSGGKLSVLLAKELVVLEDDVDCDGEEGDHGPVAYHVAESRT